MARCVSRWPEPCIHSKILLSDSRHGRWGHCLAPKLAGKDRAVLATALRSGGVTADEKTALQRGFFKCKPRKTRVSLLTAKLVTLGPDFSLFRSDK